MESYRITEIIPLYYSIFLVLSDFCRFIIPSRMSSVRTRCPLVIPLPGPLSQALPAIGNSAMRQGQALSSTLVIMAYAIGTRRCRLLPLPNIPTDQTENL